MNGLIVFSAAVLLCMCAGSDAMSLGRQGAGKPRIIVVRQNHPRSGGRTDSAAQTATSTATAAAVEAPASQTAQSTSASANPAMPPMSPLEAWHNDLFLANALDMPFIPYGADPMNYHLMENYGDIPFLPLAPSRSQQGVDPLRSMLIADKMDMPMMYF